MSRQVNWTQSLLDQVHTLYVVQEWPAARIAELCSIPAQSVIDKAHRSGWERSPEARRRDKIASGHKGNEAWKAQRDGWPVMRGPQVQRDRDYVRMLKSALAEERAKHQSRALAEQGAA